MVNYLDLLGFVLVIIAIVSMVVFIIYAMYIHIDIYKSMFRNDNDKWFGAILVLFIGFILHHYKTFYLYIGFVDSSLYTYDNIH